VIDVGDDAKVTNAGDGGVGHGINPIGASKSVITVYIF
jgi:hypothetical protein